MSTDAPASAKRRLELVASRRQGLRVALAIAGGFTLALLDGDVLPFLGPLFAAQFLLASRRPLALRQGLGTVILIIGVGALLVFLTAAFGQRPWVLLPLLWLFYFTCFWVQGQGKGGAAPGLALIIAIVVPLLDILQHDLGESIVLLLTKAVSGGMLLAWLAHGLLPDPVREHTPEVPAAPSTSALATRQALASASILLLIVALCLVDARLATAMVLPITVATLLSQLELATTQRAAIGLLIVNLLGGVAALLACTLVQLRPTVWLLFLTLLLVSLLFAGRAVTNTTTGKVFGGGLTTFLILFGLSISPLPTSTPELFSTRLAYVFCAILYALFMAALLWPRPLSQGADEALNATEDPRRD
jgi:hypothetical protein